MKKSALSALLVPFLVLLAAAAAVAAEPAAAPAAAPAPAEASAPPPKPLGQGDKIDAITLSDVDGKAVDTALAKGLTAITFFNTSCSACKAEMALLNGLAKQNKDLKVLAISVDAQGAKTTKPFIEGSKYDRFAFFIDPEYKAPEKFGFSFSPALIVVRDGVIVLKHAGFQNKDEELLVKTLLK